MRTKEVLIRYIEINEIKGRADIMYKLIIIVIEQLEFRIQNLKSHHTRWEEAA
jgi:hypothetical protein